MDVLRLVLAAIVALVAVAALVQLGWGYLSLPSLLDVPPVHGAAPRVSIVVAARDEERHIRTAVESLLAQSYPRYEVVVVDDRSSDRTAAILEALASTDARVRVIRVHELSSGWLGKNNAMRVGAAEASGELLLFTDGDVILRPDVVARAVRLLLVEHADHVTIVPDLLAPSWSLALVVNYFMMWGFLALRAWKAREPRSSAYAGIGAFNLIRADAYRAIGGHSRIPLRPDDDLMLGKLLKQAGRRQIVAIGDGEVVVEWYPSLGALARGLRKNSFAAMQYNTALALGAFSTNVTIGVVPFLALWFATGWERALWTTAALAQMIGYAAVAWTRRLKPWLALLYPVAAALFIGIFAAAVARTLRRRGIEWRGTFYPLDELRGNKS